MMMMLITIMIMLITVIIMLITMTMMLITNDKDINCTASKIILIK